jgi:putative aldouronate transport system permease protein
MEGKKAKLLDKIELEDFDEEFEASKLKRNTKTFIKDWRLYLMLLPIVIFFLLWKYRPMIGLLFAFKGFNNFDSTLLGTINNAEFRGLYYIQQLLSNVDFWRAFRNTFVISLEGLIFGFPVPIILAIFFSEIKNPLFRSITQIVSYLPKFVSTVVITTIIIMMVSGSTTNSEGGVLFKLLVDLGLANPDSIILKEAKYFRPIYHISGIWQGAGYGSIVYFAAIMGISPTNYEAAKMDGANKLAQIRFVTLPCIAPTLTIMLILRIGDMLQVGYEKVLLLYNFNTYEVADVLSTFVLRMSIGDGNQTTGGAGAFSLATAADLFNSLIAMFLVLGANFISRKVSETSLF